MRLGAGTIFDLKAIRPVFLANDLIVVLRPDAVMRPDFFLIRLRLMRNALTDEELTPRRGWRRLQSPWTKRQKITVLGAVIPVQGLGDLSG